MAHSKKDLALYYAQTLGWALIPLQWITSNGKCSCGADPCHSKPGKHPLTSNGKHDASSDLAQIATWWDANPDANIGLRTGEMSGVVVLDVDEGVTKDGVKKEGIKQAYDLMAKYPDVVASPVCQITSGGGYHLFYKYPGKPIKNVIGLDKDVYPHLDLIGDNYILIYPSVAAGPYSFPQGSEPWAVAMPELPATLIAYSDNKSEMAAGTAVLDANWDGALPASVKSLMATSFTLTDRMNRKAKGGGVPDESQIDASIAGILVAMGVRDADVIANAIRWSNTNAGLAHRIGSKSATYLSTTVGKALAAAPALPAPALTTPPTAAAVDEAKKLLEVLIADVKASGTEAISKVILDEQARDQLVLAAAQHPDIWALVGIALEAQIPVRSAAKLLKPLNEDIGIATKAARIASGAAAPGGEGGENGLFQPEVVQAVAKLNERYGFIILGGRDTVLDLRSNKVELLNTFSFKLLMDNTRYRISERVQMGIGSIWLIHPDRLTFDGTDYTSGPPRPGSFNLFRGFKYQRGPAPAQIPMHLLFFEHLWENVAQGDAGLFYWMVAWMARMIQHPEKPSYVSLVLRGKRGVGKSVVFDSLEALFNGNTMTASDPKHVVGSFNAHLMDCCLLIADEGFFAGDKKHEGALKRIITQKDLTIEVKGKDVFKSDNHITLGITSNEAWVVPTGIGERRFTVVDVGEKRMQDTVYFTNLREQLEQGGYQELFNYLINMDLATLPKSTVFYNTNALTNQIIESLDPIEGWWFKCLQTGSITVDEKGRPEQWTQDNVKIAAVIDAYRRFDNIYGNRRATNVGKKLHKMCPSMEGGYGATERADRTNYRFPSLETARAEFEQYIGGEFLFEAPPTQ